MIFDPQSTKAYKAILFKGTFARAMLFVFLLLSFLFFLAFVLFDVVKLFPLWISKDEILGFLFFSLGFLFLFFSLVKFAKSLNSQDNKKTLKDAEDLIKKGENVNIAEYLTKDALESVLKAILFTKNKSIDLTYNSVFLFLLQNKRSDFIFSRLLINKEHFTRSVEVIVQSQKKKKEKDIQNHLNDIISDAFDIAKKRGNEKITYGSIFAAVALHDKTIQNLFFDYGAKKEDVIEVAFWEELYFKEKNKKVPLHISLMQTPGIADDWAFGYTPTLNVYSRPVNTSKSSGEHIHPLGREEEILKIEEILSSSGTNNVILVGEPGVGIDSVILGFTKRIKKGLCPVNLRFKKVVKLDMNAVVSKSKDISATTSLLDKIFSEAKGAGNIILIIENLHNYILSEPSNDKIDISTVLNPYLKSDQFQLIATSDHFSYHSNIEANSSISVLLQKVEIKEPSEEQTLIILQDLAPYIERKEKVFISYPALSSCVSDAGSYIQNIPFPEKALSLLSEVISFVKSHKVYGNIITQDHVTEVISQKTGIPLGRITGEEKAKLLNMERLLHERIIGQDQAIKVLAEALRRVRSGISERKKPIGTFLFLGPTGVGKTETAKALAEVYFGSENRMIRLDMTEYQDKDSIQRLIGSADKNVEAQFANKVRENPFSLILLDEFEKSHPDIADLFLQVLDEGRLTDAFQRKVSFKNTIIIATSNAGAEFIREYVLSGQNLDILHEKLVEHLLKEGIFKPEFLNRFDATVVFKPLEKEQIKQIAKLNLMSLSARLEEKGMKFKITDELLEKIAEIGYNPVFGAREMKRIIQEKIENKIAEDIIKGKYKYGSEIYIDPQTII